MVLDLREELAAEVDVTGATVEEVAGAPEETTVVAATELEAEGEFDEDVVTGTELEGAEDAVGTGTGVVDAPGAEESVCSDWDVTEKGREVNS